jgi:hypothetical protein
VSKRDTGLASLSSKAMELFTDHVDGQMSTTTYPSEAGDRFGQVVC